MAVGVVDRLELVDVDKEDRELPLLGTLPFGLEAEVFEEVAAVGQLGEGIAEGQLSGAAQEILEALSDAPQAF